MSCIPPITHELGQHWEQPARAEIEIDETHALMTRRTFDGLAEYSATRPSGFMKGRCGSGTTGRSITNFSPRRKPVWLLCWYGLSDKPGMVSNHSRRILVVE